MNSEFPEEVPQYGNLQLTSDLTSPNDEAELILEGIAEDMATKVGL
jgi:hypothetical protein